MDGLLDAQPFWTADRLKSIAQVTDLYLVTSLRLEVDTTTGTCARVGELLPNLKMLRLTGHVPQIRDLGTRFTGLTTLTLASAGVEDLDGIHALPALRELDLSGNKLADLSPLAFLDDLRILRLHNNHVADWDQLHELAALPSLRSLTFAGNPVLATAASRQDARDQIVHILPSLRQLDDAPVSLAVLPPSPTHGPVHAPVEAVTVAAPVPPVSPPPAEARHRPRPPTTPTRPSSMPAPAPTADPVPASQRPTVPHAASEGSTSLSIALDDSDPPPPSSSAAATQWLVHLQRLATDHLPGGPLAPNPTGAVPVKRRSASLGHHHHHHHIPHLLAAATVPHPGGVGGRGSPSPTNIAVARLPPLRPPSADLAAGPLPPPPGGAPPQGRSPRRASGIVIPSIRSVGAGAADDSAAEAKIVRPHPPTSPPPPPMREDVAGMRRHSMVLAAARPGQ
ncbi:hypothetical protein H9P43_007181 [Blastocladiella emersonii ATCC 22665]|nr:hypothetical protein H9P43_007181 [Blastocladiella emersonii ATCC 22665]